MVGISDNSLLLGLNLFRFPEGAPFVLIDDHGVEQGLIRLEIPRAPGVANQYIVPSDVEYHDGSLYLLDQRGWIVQYPWPALNVK
jgi:hypothetical protein